MEFAEENDPIQSISSGMSGCSFLQTLLNIHKIKASVKAVQKIKRSNLENSHIIQNVLVV